MLLLLLIPASDDSYLLQSLVQGYPLSIPSGGVELTPSNMLDVTEMDSGVKRHRRKFRVNIDAVNVEWMLSVNQFEVFRRWFSKTINYGQKWFKLPIPTGAVGEDCPYPLRECRFSDGNTWKSTRLSGAYIRVTATINVLDRSVTANTNGSVSYK